MSHVVSYLNQSGILSWKDLSFTLWLVSGAASNMLSWWSTWPLFLDITSAQNVRKQRSDTSQLRLCKTVYTLMINTDWMQSANPNKVMSSDLQVYIKSFGSIGLFFSPFLYSWLNHEGASPRHGATAVQLAGDHVRR